MKTAVRFVLSVAVAALLVALLLRWSNTSISEVAGTVASLDRGVYLAAFAVQAAIYPIRAARLGQLLPGGGPGTLRLTSLGAAHVLAANILPAKVGEAALVLYLRRAGIPGANGLAVLLLSRLLDFVAVTGGLALACLALASFGAYPEQAWLAPLGGALLIPAFGCFWAVFSSERCVAFGARILRAVGLERTLLGAKILGFAERVRTALAAVPRGRLWGAAAATVPIWLLVFTFYGILARGLGMGDLSFAAATFGAGLAILATLLPVNGFAGFGVQDAGWVAGFTSLGVAADIATSSGLAAHVIYIANLALFGALGHVVMGMWIRRGRA